MGRVPKKMSQCVRNATKQSVPSLHLSHAREVILMGPWTRNVEKNGQNEAEMNIFQLIIEMSETLKFQCYILFCGISYTLAHFFRYPTHH